MLIFYHLISVTHASLMDDEMYPYPHDKESVENPAHSYRQKRQSISTYDREHHIETLITADYAVRNFHGDSHVTTYLMTMMHIVSIYRVSQKKVWCRDRGTIL